MRATYLKRGLKENLSGNEVYYTNSSISLVNNMLCSKLPCQKGFNLLLFSCKNSELLWENPSPTRPVHVRPGVLKTALASDAQRARDCGGAMEGPLERDNRLRTLCAARPNAPGYTGGCDQEQGVITSHGLLTCCLFLSFRTWGLIPEEKQSLPSG